MAALPSSERELYVEMRQRYQSNFCGKERSNHSLLFLRAADSYRIIDVL